MTATCVCVCQPLCRRVSTVRFRFLLQAGALSTPWQTQCNEAMPWSGKHGLITRVYLRQLGTVEHAVHFALFTSPQTGFPAVLQPLPLALTVKLWLNNTFLRTHAPFRSFAFLLGLGIELTENQCQSVCEGQRTRAEPNGRAGKQRSQTYEGT